MVASSMIHASFELFRRTLRHASLGTGLLLPAILMTACAPAQPGLGLNAPEHRPEARTAAAQRGNNGREVKRPQRGFALARQMLQQEAPEPPDIELPPLELPPLSERDAERWSMVDNGGFTECAGQSLPVAGGPPELTHLTEYSHGIVIEGEDRTGVLRLSLFESTPFGGIYQQVGPNELEMEMDVLDLRSDLDQMWITFSVVENDCMISKTFDLATDAEQ